MRNFLRESYEYDGGRDCLAVTRTTNCSGRKWPCDGRMHSDGRLEPASLRGSAGVAAEPLPPPRARTAHMPTEVVRRFELRLRCLSYLGVGRTQIGLGIAPVAWPPATKPLGWALPLWRCVPRSEGTLAPPATQWSAHATPQPRDSLDYVAAASSVSSYRGKHGFPATLAGSPAVQAP